MSAVLHVYCFNTPTDLGCPIKACKVLLLFGPQRDSGMFSLQNSVIFASGNYTDITARLTFLHLGINLKLMNVHFALQKI